MTQDNPFRPPAARLGDLQVVAVQRARPFAVWLLQILLGLMVAAMVLSLLRTARAVVEVGAVVEARNHIRPVELATYALLHLAILAGVLFFMRSVHLGKRWARWLGCVAILVLAGLCFALPDTTSYANESQRAGGTLGRYTVVPALWIWWAWAFAFTQKAKHYFARSSSDAA